MKKLILISWLLLPLVAKANCKTLGPKLLGMLASHPTLKNIVQVEHEFLANCQDAKITGAVEKAKSEYLATLGVMAKNYPAGEKEVLFRGLVCLDDDAAPLKKRIQGVKPTNSAMSLLQNLYGGVGRVRDVLVLGATPKQQKTLEEFLFEICPDEKECPLWNKLTLYKVIFVSPTGLAGYLPDIAELVLSSSLLDNPNELHKLVMLHELAHVAELYTVIRAGRVWSTEFASFSGWAKTKDGKWTAKATRTPASFEDGLTKLSAGSAFSMLPDSVYAAEAGFDGFVTGKSFEETAKREDVSEDMADHIAVYRYAPERFCLSGKEIAPKKFKWIAENVFPFRDPPKLSCVKR